MCGRFSLNAELFVIEDRFHAQALAEWRPRFNIAPAQPVLVVANDENRRTLTLMKWGITPRWSHIQLINARLESVLTKPMYRDDLSLRRCLIPADGFYEWETGKNKKIPFRITLKSGELFGFAGLWENYQDENGKEQQAVAIITVPANELVYPLHNRMPLILDKKSESAWLDSTLTDKAEIEAAIASPPSEKLSLYQVSTLINSWKNDTPECIQPV